MDIVYALLYTSARLSQRYGNRELLCQIMGYFKYILSNCHKNERLISSYIVHSKRERKEEKPLTTKVSFIKL